MNAEDIIREIEDWIEDSVLNEDAPGDGFYVETYEHATIIRWGSKRGDFPCIGTSLILGETHIIESGEVRGTTIIADTGAKTTIDVEQLAYKHFLETLMVNGDKGYEIETAPLRGETFKIRVERLTPKDTSIDDVRNPSMKNQKRPKSANFVTTNEN